MHESPKNGRALFLILLMIFAAILIRALLTSGDPDVKKLNSQVFQQAVEERAFAVHPEEDQPTANDAGQAAEAARESERGVREKEEKDSVNDGAAAKPGPLLVKDEDQTVTGLLKRDGGQTQEFEYSYPEHYDIAAVLNEANIPFTTDPQNAGFWTRMLVGAAPIFLEAPPIGG